MNAKAKLKKYRLGQLYKLPNESIEPDPNQPKKYFDPKQIKNLAESIMSKGVLKPILIRKENEKIILVAGERRLRASKEAERKTITALFITGDTNEISLIENLQREDLNSIKEAESLVRFMDERGYKDKDLVTFWENPNPLLAKSKN